jgi:hypothetical protein
MFNSESSYNELERQCEEAFDKVVSGEWCYSEFRDFITDIRSSAKREVE